MRQIFAITLTVALGAWGLATAAFAADTARQSSMKSCAATWKTMSDADKKQTKYTDYMGRCMKGASAAKSKDVAAPAMAMKPAPAMTMAEHRGGQARCKDGKIVTYKNRSGTCSGHGGVAAWM